MGPYFADVGPVRGPCPYDAVPDAIGVLEAADNSMPIGMALRTSRGAAGAAVWKLTIHGHELPGRWVLIDREFRPAQ